MKDALVAIGLTAMTLVVWLVVVGLATLIGLVAVDIDHHENDWGRIILALGVCAVLGGAYVAWFSWLLKKIG